MTNERRSFLYVTIIDFSFDFQLILVQYEIFKVMHFSLDFGFSTFVNSDFALSVFIFV